MLAPARTVLLFDLDNTLLDRDAVIRRYAQDFIARHAGAFGDEAAEASLRSFLALDARGRSERHEFCAALKHRYPALPYTAEGLWQDQRQIPDFVVPDAALLAMLERLAARHPLQLLSNGSSALQRRKFVRAGLAPFFPQAVISEEVGCAKPDAAIFRLALARCPAGPAVMIGDDLDRDIAPAQALGLQTVWVNACQEPCTPGIVPSREIATILALEEALPCLT